MRKPRLPTPQEAGLIVLAIFFICIGESDRAWACFVAAGVIQAVRHMLDQDRADG